MSDADLLRALFADWARGEFSTGVRLFADDMHFTTAEPEGQFEGYGPAGVRRFMERFLAVWHFYAIRLDRLEDLGDGRYLASGTQFARGKESGTETTHPAHVAFRMQRGKITRFAFCFSREDALAALAARTSAP